MSASSVWQLHLLVGGLLQITQPWWLLRNQMSLITKEENKCMRPLFQFQVGLFICDKIAVFDPILKTEMLQQRTSLQSSAHIIQYTNKYTEKDSGWCCFLCYKTADTSHIFIFSSCCNHVSSVAHWGRWGRGPYCLLLSGKYHIILVTRS